MVAGSEERASRDTAPDGRDELQKRYFPPQIGWYYLLVAYG
jgi:hypothetical protein